MRDLQAVASTVSEFHHHDNINDLTETVGKVKKIQQLLRELEVKAKLYNAVRCIHTSSSRFLRCCSARDVVQPARHRVHSAQRDHTQVRAVRWLMFVDEFVAYISCSFLSLWTSTADWVRWQKEWMTNPLLKLDPEQVRFVLVADPPRCVVW